MRKLKGIFTTANIFLSFSSFLILSARMWGGVNGIHISSTLSFPRDKLLENAPSQHSYWSHYLGFSHLRSYFPI